MRIGIFTDTYLPYISGLVTSELMLKEALEKLGHEVYIVTANLESFKYEFNEKEKIIKVPGVPVGIYDARLTGIYPIQAINKIKEWNLDVIHSQTEFGIGTFARIIAKQLDIPIVHTYHTMYEDYIHYITKGHFMGTGKKVVEYLTKFYCDKTVTELIVPTKKAYDLFKEKYKVDRNVHIIPTGIEVERFYKERIKKENIDKLKQSLNLQSSDVVITFVGRLGKEKSVDFLIDCHKDIVKKHKNVKLLIIGDGPEMEDFKKQVKKYKLESSVIFTGKVPWEEIPTYYQLTDIFATASRTETQGLTVIEAMAGSIPVVAADDDSFKNVVIDGLNGNLFSNKKQYKKQIEFLLENEDKRKYMAHQARITAEKHSSKYFAEQVLDVYKIATGDRPLKNNKKTYWTILKDKVKSCIKK